MKLARCTGTRLVSCTVKPSEAELNLRLKRDHPDTVVCFLGVHPSDVTPELPSVQLTPMMGLCDGIGEVGLDAKYSDASDGSVQMRCFLDQLELAERWGKPLQVHSRGSERACLEALTSYRLRSVLMHWFEDEERLSEVNSRGYFVSVGPAVLYSKRIRRIATRVAGERLLTESDGPVSFKPIRGSGGPSLIPSVLFALAELRGAEFAAVAETVEDNLRAYLVRSPG